MAFSNIPHHVAIIMDGNGRWAQKRLLPRSAGHLQGARNLLEVVAAAGDAGVSVVTVYAFSTENWKRPLEEVSYLMGLISSFCIKYRQEMLDKGIRLLCTGDLSALPEEARASLEELMAETSRNDRLTLCIALNYGGRTELVDAVNALMADKTRPGGPVTEQELSRYLYHPELPDPDLLIRTGGEQRLSNFLLWELSYAEFYFTDVLWPDFGRKELNLALEAYSLRQRRYGGVK